MPKNSIGQFLAALRKSNGMTQQNVADRLNVSNKAVSRWERDECAPDLSLIPALAEMFDVTCDELLKGERINEPTKYTKKNLQIDKQIKNLVNRTLSSFKSQIWIALAVSIVGIICMFGISYGFHKPIISYAVMLLCELIAFLLTILALNKAKNIKTDNELFAEAGETLISKFNHTLGQLSFISFFAITSVVLLSLPIVLFTSDYVKYVISIKNYFVFFFYIIILVQTLIFLKCKEPYIRWIAGSRLFIKSTAPVTQNIYKITAIQLGLTLLGGLIMVLASYLDKPTDSSLLYNTVTIIGIICLAGSILYFTVYIIRHMKNRKPYLLIGIRNILLIPSAIILSKIHKIVWFSNTTESEPLTRHDYWHTEYLWYSIAFSLFVFVIFAIIEVFNKAKSSKISK